MSDQKKHGMKRIITTISATVAIITAASLPSYAQDSKYMDSYIEVNGSAEQEVSPDLFYIRVDINEQDSKGRISVEEQQDKMLKELKKQGVDLETQVIRLSLSSSYYNRRTNLASASYQIKLTTPAQLSKVWGKLDELGLSGVKFQKAEYSDIDRLKEKVRRQAVQNARQTADLMAEALGQKAGKCFYLYGGYTDASTVYARPLMLSKAIAADTMNMAEESSGAESLDFDKIKVTAKVTARFVLE